MSQVAVVVCPRGIVCASESLVSYGDAPGRDYIQKVYPLGPRLVFAAVGNASLPDPRIDDRWPGLGAHLRTLTGSQPVQGEPLEVARRVGEFVVDVLDYMTAHPRGYEGVALATFQVRYVVAGYSSPDSVGMATSWTATAAEAFEDDRATTEQPGRLALGVFEAWPRVQRRRPLAGPATPGDEARDPLERATAQASWLVREACRQHPAACGGPLQAVRITAEGGLEWVERPEWVRVSAAGL